MGFVGWLGGIFTAGSFLRGGGSSLRSPAASQRGHFCHLLLPYHLPSAHYVLAEACVLKASLLVTPDFDIFPRCAVRPLY